MTRLYTELYPELVEAPITRWNRLWARIPQLDVPKSKHGQFLFFFVTEFISYFLIVANTRAFSQASYFWTCITDIVWAGMTFVLWRLMVGNKDARTWSSGLGYMLGGTSGSLLSIFCTVHLYGK